MRFCNMQYMKSGLSGKKISAHLNVKASFKFKLETGNFKWTRKEQQF